MAGTKRETVTLKCIEKCDSEARAGREYWSKYFVLSWSCAKSGLLLDPHPNCSITLCCRRLSVLYGLLFASTVIWNFLFSNWRTMKITVVPGRSYVAIVGAMSWWKIWRLTLKFVGEERKREMRLPCLLMRMMSLGGKMESGLHPNFSDKLRLWTHLWGYPGGPWEPLNQTFSIVGLTTKGTYQLSFQSRIIYVSYVWD